MIIAYISFDNPNFSDHIGNILAKFVNDKQA